jgi:hypothetical protein
VSNASVIQRMHTLLDQYRANELSAGELEQAVEFHLDALEFIDLDVVHRARSLCSKLTYAHFLDGDEEFGEPQDAAAALAEFHQFLDTLPIGPPD